ncbi:MAG TPA: hypothetical protein VEK08_03800 [Planctomycetota bacterium]|nr:hypothetical protein [Planctomycetota bacterium]
MHPEREANKVLRSPSLTTLGFLFIVPLLLLAAAIFVRKPAGSSSLRPDAAGKSLKVVLLADRPWFGVRDRITGKFQLEGGAVNGSRVRLTLSSPKGDVLQKIEATAGMDGRGEFDFESLPEDRLEAAGGAYRVCLDLSDADGTAASGSLPVYIGESPVIVEAHPEGGRLVRGLENRIRFLARLRDGTPSATRLRIQRSTVSDQHNAADLMTDENGTAVWQIANPQPPHEVFEVFTDFKDARPQQIVLPVREQHASENK